jgi:hypothetical protein
VTRPDAETPLADCVNTTEFVGPTGVVGNGKEMQPGVQDSLSVAFVATAVKGRQAPATTTTRARLHAWHIDVKVFMRFGIHF